jgi:threonine dehydrogenase-like Zn-dependent dehydrogenase
MTFEEGTCCACGTGTAYHALKRLAVSGMDTLAIFGQGPVGLSATMLAKVMGARVIAIDVVPERLNLAKQFGAVTVDAAKADAVTVINEMTNGEGADATMDCTGMERPRVDTLRSARLWGRAAFIGEKGTATFDITEHIIGKQITIYGSRTFSTLGLAEVANFVVSHEVPLKDLITHTFPFAQADEAYRVFESGKTGKVALVMS